MYRLPPIPHKELNPRQARVSGILLISIGLVLTAFAAAIIAVLFGLIALENIIPGTYRDPNAPPPATPVAAVIFVSFFVLFGLITLGQGIWQIVFGARNRVLMIIMIVMGALLVAAGILARALK